MHALASVATSTWRRPAGVHLAALLALVVLGTHLENHAVGQQPAISNVPDSISGTVLLPDGKPAADAPVILFWHKPFAKTRSDDEGGFTMNLDVERIESEVGDEWRRMAVAAFQPGSGVGWDILGRVTDTTSVELHLAEDMPVRGKVLDQQGRPVRGAQVTVESLYRAKDENLDGFLKASRDQPTRLMQYEGTSMIYLSPEAILKLQGIKDQRRPAATTDEEGQFQFTGFGRERSLFATVEGPGITNESFFIVTREHIDARWKRGQLSRATQMDLDSGAPMRSVYAADFHHLAAPALTIRGRLTDAETGAPVEGMRLSARMKGHLTPGVATSDQDGRYEIKGLPTEGQMRLSVLNPGDQPYLDAEIERNVSATRPLGAIDFKLDRGALITGVVTDRRTGEPVAGNIGYLSWPNNESLNRLHQPYDTFNTQATDKHGRYAIVVPPGPGVLAFQARHRTQYDFAESSDFGFPTGQAGMFLSGNRGYFRPDEFHFLKRIEPSASTREVQIDITIGRGPVMTVRATKAGGGFFQQLDVRGIRRLSRTTVPGGEFEIGGMKAGEKRSVFVRDPEREFAGVFELEFTENAPVADLQVERSATVSGHLVNADGRPQTRWMVAAVSAGAVESAAQNNGLSTPGFFEFDETQTDADGYFRLTGLPPGVRVEIAVAKNVEGRRPDVSAVKTLTLRPDQQLAAGQLSTK
ncbi:carboxypeptidase-like regulatory domain-containing protein [Roseiconus nitratireducens]|uniref:carboxypeptidase-like regulatory domain-containing protein n=1 Tax=Roseiconus nitratireducens TaxID=2605748 RepID=UPI001375EA51|nr:carboxypeptidase-like regulatory domain-containing protein [Roseiconus nitratireducens]